MKKFVHPNKKKLNIKKYFNHSKIFKINFFIQLIN